MAEKTLKFGVIGAGRIGRLHIEHLALRLPEAEVLIVSDVHKPSATECARRFGIPRCASNYCEVLEHPDVQAVVICSPTDTHADLIQASASAKKHVFCEKPIDSDLHRIDETLAVVERSGVVLQVGFNRRFDPNFRRIRQAVANGEIGTPHQLRITSRDPAPPPIEYVAKSGGIFMDMTIHDFDMARYLIGSEVVEVYATGSARVDPAIGEAGDLDTATILLKFQNGAVGVIENCRQAVYGYDQRAEVFGSAGSILSDNNYANNALVLGKERIHRDLPLNFFMDRYVESYLIELREFITAVTGGGSPPVTGLDARAPVVMAIAAKRSVAENRPVKLAEIG